MLLRNEVKCLVATSALGMGYDKPDLGFVVHFQGPGSPIAYYQQVGRAGRGLKEADAVLLRGTEDRDVQDFFIKSAFPPAEQVAKVMALFDEADGPLSVGALMNEINLGKGRMELMLKQLEVEGALNKVRGGWERSRREWVYDEERITAVTAARRAEQKAMELYGTDGRCLMESPPDRARRPRRRALRPMLDLHRAEVRRRARPPPLPPGHRHAPRAPDRDRAPQVHPDRRRRLQEDPHAPSSSSPAAPSPSSTTPAGAASSSRASSRTSTSPTSSSRPPPP